MAHCRPKQAAVTLPGDRKVISVTYFDFQSMLHSLLTDPVLVSNLSMLDVNADDPFSCYKTTDGVLSTVNSGQWYQTAYDNLIENPMTDFLVPICFACDEAKLQRGGKAGCWPVVFSTTIFSQKLRNLPIAWRPLGYVYDLSMEESPSEAEGQSKDLKYACLHAIFKAILDSLVEVQQNSTLTGITLSLGKKPNV